MHEPVLMVYLGIAMVVGVGLGVWIWQIADQEIDQKLQGCYGENKD